MRKAKNNKRRKGDLDIIVLLCVVAGLAMTVTPLVLCFVRCEVIPDAYFQYGFHFWGSELIATVAVYWLKTKKPGSEEGKGVEPADPQDTVG